MMTTIKYFPTSAVRLGLLIPSHSQQSNLSYRCPYITVSIDFNLCLMLPLTKIKVKFTNSAEMFYNATNWHILYMNLLTLKTFETREYFYFYIF